MISRQGTVLLAFVTATAISLTAATMAQAGLNGASAQPQHAAGTPAVGQSPHLVGGTVTIPLVFVKGYPFVEGEIDGHRGKLLFDLGDPGTLTVNSHAIHIKGERVTGRGFFGSGQTYVTASYPVVAGLTLAGGERYADLADIRGNGGEQLERNITPDFIGWLGTAFFRGYAVKIDYKASKLTFYSDGMTAATRGERVIRTVGLGNPAHPNLAVFPITVGGHQLEAALDTGTHNTAWLKDAERDALQQAGLLRRVGENWEMNGIRIDGYPLPPMPIEITKGRPPFRKFLPKPDAAYVSFGYEFLSRYTVALDLGRGELDLIAP